MRRSSATISIVATPERILAGRRLVERALMTVLGHGLRTDPFCAEYHVSFAPEQRPHFTVQVTDVEYHKVLIECERIAQAEAWARAPIEVQR